MIDQETIDRILDAAQIVDVVSDFVSLRKRGVNYIGLCPFHNEKTPSFSVSPSKGICKCFSCGKGGNVVHFIMEHEQLTYPEALRYLAKKYNIEIREKGLSQEDKLRLNTRESMYVVNNFANDYFRYILKNSTEGKNYGLAYFRQRGFRDDIIDKFQLGYSTLKSNALSNAAIRRGYKAEYLLKTGLCFQNEQGQLYDRFRGRAIFPVHTLSGKIVAFGGRILDTEKKKLAKYVNSPESEIYHKSNEIYGIYFAKQAIARQDRCYLVEGYTDVISMHQTGIENVVSSSGTALTPGQIHMIHRFTSNITILYDSDLAGIKASLRGINILLEEGMNVKVCLLPDGEDPDSFAQKHNSDEFLEYIQKHETDFIHFKISLLLDEIGKDPSRRAGLIKDIVRSISVIPEAITRSVYIGECSRMLCIDENILITEITKLINQPVQNTNPVPADPGKSNGIYNYEKLLVQAIVLYGEKIISNRLWKQSDNTPVSVIEYIVKALQKNNMVLYTPLHQRILSEASPHIHDTHFIAKRFFMDHPDKDIRTLAVSLADEEYQISQSYSNNTKAGTEEERLSEVVPMLVINFKSAIVTQELSQIMLDLQTPSVQNDPGKCNTLMQRYKELKDIQSQMAKLLGSRVILG